MPITVQWHNDKKTTIYYEFVGSWTWYEFDNVYQEVYTMLDTVSHKVDAIVDLRRSQLLPNNTLSEMRRLTFQQHENGGITVFVTDNRFAKSLFTILTGVLKQAKSIFHITSTLDEAHQLLDERHNNLN